MRKLVLVVLVGLFLTVCSSYVKAEDAAQKQEVSGGMMESHGKKMGRNKMKDSGKMMKMFHAMMIKNMVATKDGGVILLVGNKLQKYDKDLVLQKEVEVKIDEEQMQKMMSHCPKRNGEMKAEREEAKKDEPSAAVKK